ncbi:transcriptional regulator, partial [Acinetobacter baumannii]|nr:transcriptional regulator [Acinetobacter baumannii]
MVQCIFYFVISCSPYMYKSEQLAHSIRQLIESGTLNAHEKLPSLRDQVQRSGFSLMTVMN